MPSKKNVIEGQCPHCGITIQVKSQDDEIVFSAIGSPKEDTPAESSNDLLDFLNPKPKAKKVEPESAESENEDD